MMTTRARAVVVLFVGALGLTSAGFNTNASASGSSLTRSVPVASNAFCFPAIKLVGTYSVNVEWALGLNDGQPMPTRMTSRARTAVTAMARESLALSTKAPTTLMAGQLRRLSVELRQSRLPVDVVRAEAAFGATGYQTLGRACPSVTMIMTPTNPLGGFNPE
jgi:hypothetical protein